MAWSKTQTKLSNIDRYFKKTICDVPDCNNQADIRIMNNKKICARCANTIDYFLLNIYAPDLA